MRKLQRAGIDTLLAGHARIVAQAFMQLVMANIDGDDMMRAPLQQHLRKTAGGSTDIERGPALHIEVEMVKRGNKLNAARET